jgi:hypothetical protein
MSVEKLTVSREVLDGGLKANGHPRMLTVLRSTSDPAKYDRKDVSAILS